jgi:hypothetical protein
MKLNKNDNYFYLLKKEDIFPLIEYKKKEEELKKLENEIFNKNNTNNNSNEKNKNENFNNYNKNENVIKISEGEIDENIYKKDKLNSFKSKADLDEID